MFKSISFILLFAFQLFYVNAQISQLRFKHYTTNEGLSQGDIYHMAQDSRGFMWFGTFDGLNRFDGYNFKVFRPDYNDTNSIKGGRINSIIENKDGMMWVGTNEALNCYDFKTDHFKHFYIEDSSHQQLKISYDPFFIDDKNELWFIYNYHYLGSINLLTAKITTYYFADGAFEEFTAASYPEKSFYRPLSKIYSAGVDGLSIVDIVNKQTHFYFSSNPKNQLGERTYIRGFLEDKNGIIWLATQNGLTSFNPVTMETQLYTIGEKKDTLILQALAMDHQGNIWCGYYGMGLNFFNTITKKFSSSYIKNSASPESIAQNTVVSLFIDKDKNIWMGIDPVGIDKINPSYEQLNHIKITPEKKDADYSSSIWSLAEIDSNNIFICSNHKELILYDKSKDESKLFHLPGGLNGSNIYHTMLDSHKRIWIASHAGIFYSDDVLKTIKVMLNRNFYNAYIAYKVYLFEYNKKLLIGTGDGLYSVSIDKQTNNTDTIHSFDGKQISFINKSPAGLLTVSTNNNEWFLIRMDSTGEHVIKKKNFNFLIKSIFFQDENIVWFGTGSGLVHYDILKDSLKVFTEKDGLANNYVYCVLKGNDGNLWMSTNHGISKFNVATEKFSNYGIAEGAQSLEFNTHSFFQSASGTIYFGGVKGFNYFNPLKIKAFDFEPPVEVLSISVNGSPVSLDKFLQQSEPVKFKSNDNNISIEFAAIDFNREDNIDYLYKLRNKDPWISIGNRRTLTFANLSPGNYYLTVKAQYSNSAISPHTLQLAFIVLPPFYKTYWFILLIVAVIIIGIYAMYRYRIREFLKLQAIRNNIARDLHDEIGSTLGSISIYSEVAKELSYKNEKADEAISKIGTVSRDLIDKMSDIVWSINPVNESFDQLQNRMQAFAAMMLTPGEIKFTFPAPANIIRHVFSMQKRRNIYLIFKEAINNIVKYADCTIVNIDLNIHENIFCMMIEDNGKGFDLHSNTVYNGNGIKNMKSRSQDMNAQLNINSIINKGTTIRVTLKV